MHAPGDHELERRRRACAACARRRAPRRPATAPAPRAARMATSSPPAATLEHERRELGARLEPAPLDRVEEVVEIAHAERGAERARERRLRAGALAHARAGPDRALDDVAGAAELAEALGHRARGLARRRCGPAATAPVPAEETQPTGPDAPARSAAKASLVTKRRPPSSSDAERLVEAHVVARPVDAGEREGGGGDVVRAQPPASRARASTATRDRAHRAVEADALPVRAGRRGRCRARARRGSDDGVGLRRAAVDPDHGAAGVSHRACRSRPSLSLRRRSQTRGASEASGPSGLVTSASAASERSPLSAASIVSSS